MEQLIFFAILIAFSILESMARKKKARERAQGGGGATTPDWLPTPPQEPELPTYDADPSYDEGPSYDDQPSYDERATAPQAETRSFGEAETLADLWEEIAGLAREAQSQTEPTPPAPVPEPSSGERALARVRDRDRERERVTRSRESRAVGRREEHYVHRAHAEYGTDPSERTRSEQDLLDPLAEFMTADAKAVHGQLRSQSASALRQAIILREVLGRPVSLRDEI